MSLFYILAGLGKPTSADVVDLILGSRQTGSPASFTVNADGTHTSMTGNANWETENTPTPVDTYHIKWEDHSSLANPNVTPFAKSTWTALTGAGPFTWQTTASAPNIVTRGLTLHISNDGGSTTLDSAEYSIIADESP